jgi:hypothetical protein
MSQKQRARRSCRLAVVVAAAVVAAACAHQGIQPRSRSAPNRDMEIITSGAEVEFARTACGQINFLSGRVLYSPTDGTALPIQDAVFWAAPTGDGPRTRLAIAVTQDGVFEQSVGIIGKQYLVLSQDGGFPADSHGALPIVVTARGCSEYRLSYSSNWTARDLYLKCPGR